jgi:hypothetical protein
LLNHMTAPSHKSAINLTRYVFLLAIGRCLAQLPFMHPSLEHSPFVSIQHASISLMLCYCCLKAAFRSIRQFTPILLIISQLRSFLDSENQISSPGRKHRMGMSPRKETITNSRSRDSRSACVSMTSIHARRTGFFFILLSLVSVRLSESTGIPTVSPSITPTSSYSDIEDAFLIDFISSTNVGVRLVEWSPSSLSSKCSWPGVTCSDGAVLNIALSSRSLSGTIPLSVGGVTRLTALSLNTNCLTGTIPECGKSHWS